jgi:ribosomal protein S18 acetylase RimI-like enzyme
MEARQAQVTDWEALRQLRLRALADAPDAFASTLEAEVAFPAEVWRQRARGGPASANFIAREGGLDVGLAAVFAEPDPPGRMHLVSMWVDPRYRRRGVARGLVGQVVRWAADRRAREVILWVADQNSAARRLYEQLGFQPTGERQPLPSTLHAPSPSCACPLRVPCRPQGKRRDPSRRGWRLSVSADGAAN